VRCSIVLPTVGVASYRSADVFSTGKERRGASTGTVKRSAESHPGRGTRRGEGHEVAAIMGQCLRRMGQKRLLDKGKARRVL
jgi:hypothetical protein